MTRRGNPTICNATNRDGTTCNGLAVKGSAVCRMHGGSAPQVKAAAQRRLAEEAMPLINELIQIALNEDEVRVRLAAVRDALDRLGIKEPAQVEILTRERVQSEIAKLKVELGEDD